MTPKPIVITIGEPAGIGPDIALMLMQRKLPAPVVLLTDRDLLLQRGKMLNLQATLPDFSEEQQNHPPFSVKHISLPKPSKAGQPDPENAAWILKTLEQASQGCLNGQFRALVTGPIHKATINDSGIPFTGHTELLAKLTGADLPVMLLANEALKVALVTTHLPLKQVSQSLSQKSIERSLNILNHDLKVRWGIKQPRILVCGLNPHAGEGGHLGSEEIEIIQPAIKTCQAQGINVHGPCPADTAFTPSQRKTADAVLTMYHDQGLPVIKALGFGETVNVTLGLPIVRTSVDHGTALELAGTGQANPESLLAAIELAHTLSVEPHFDRAEKAKTL